MTTNSTLAPSGDNPTYFTYVVVYSRSNGGISSLSASKPTLSEALAAAFTDATYYLGIGYPDAKIETIAENCDGCDGFGHVTKATARTRKRVRCPLCKGKHSRRMIVEDIPVVAHESMAIVDSAAVLTV